MAKRKFSSATNRFAVRFTERNSFIAIHSAHLMNGWAVWSGEAPARKKIHRSFGSLRSPQDDRRRGYRLKKQQRCKCKRSQPLRTGSPLRPPSCVGRTAVGMTRVVESVYSNLNALTISTYRWPVLAGCSATARLCLRNSSTLGVASSEDWALPSTLPPKFTSRPESGCLSFPCHAGMMPGCPEA